MNRIRKERIIFILLIVASTVIATSMVYYSISMNKKSVEAYKSNQDKIIASSMESTIEAYEQFSKFIFDAFIDKGVANELMFRASTAEETDEIAMGEIRRELYELLKGCYDTGTQYSIEQMQFILPDGNSFLRFNRPEVYGDNLLEARSLIKIVNEEKRFAKGFEIGRMVSLYRFIYPLKHEDTYVGMVEVSVSIESILDILNNMFPDKSVGFILEKEIVEAISFENAKSDYNPSFISDEYVIVEKLYVNSMDSIKNKIHSDENLMNLLKTEVQKKIKTQESFNTNVNYGGDDYIIQYQAIYDFEHQPIGYLTLVGIDHNLGLMTRAKHIELALICFAYLLFISGLVGFAMVQRKINSLAMLDSLTKVYNRYSFFEFFDKEVARSQRKDKPLCLALLDIDHFKKVNDEHGHIDGDNVLKKLVDIIKDSIRESDVLGRYGGEEFILLFPETTIQEAAIITERVRRNIENHHFKKVNNVTVSIGYAKRSKDENIDHLIERTDEALYFAKNNGRNQISEARETLC